MAGGSATPLTQPLLEPARPDYAPAGGFIAFRGLRGRHVPHLDGGSERPHPRQLTFGHADDRDPRVSPDGTRIAYSSDGAIFRSTTPSRCSTSHRPVDDARFQHVLRPVRAHLVADGDTVAFVSGTGANGTRSRRSDSKGVRTTLVTAPALQRLNSPAYSPSGNKIPTCSSAPMPRRRAPRPEPALVKDLLTGDHTVGER